MKRPFILAAIGLILILITAYFLVYKPDQDSSPSAQAAAIQQAKAYKVPAGEACIDAITPAVDKKTGAEYTFPNGCLPPGWEVVK